MANASITRLTASGSIDENDTLTQAGSNMFGVLAKSSSTTLPPVTVAPMAALPTRLRKMSGPDIWVRVWYSRVSNSIVGAPLLVRQGLLAGLGQNLVMA